MRPSMLTASLGVLTVELGAPLALARPMDPALSRLVVDPGCVVEAAPAGCLPDRALYHKLVSQWGFALAPHSVHAARTTGLSGFNVSLLAAFTGIDNSADYWRRGTRGEGLGSTNLEPAAWLQLYSLEMRKGFGFGIEAAGSIGVMPGTSLVSWGADVRVALLEGMRHGKLRYLPDMSLGVGLREATGLGELALGTLAFDARVSRPLIAPSGFIVTPWLGYQLVRIAADSALVDLTPGTDPLAECGFVGANVPGAPAGVAAGAPGSEPASAAASPVYDGSPVCQSGTGADFGNTVSFGEAAVLRQRLLLGVMYRHELLQLGAELITDLLRPDAAQTDSAVAAALRCDANGDNCQPSPRQWTLAVQVGAAF